MTFSAVFADIYSQKHVQSLPVTARVLLLVVAGAAATGIGWIGWHHAQRIVPTSLPETLYRQRCRVVRRGSASFFVVGLVMIAVGIFVGLSG